MKLKPSNILKENIPLASANRGIQNLYINYNVRFMLNFLFSLNNNLELYEAHLFTKFQEGRHIV